MNKSDEKLVLEIFEEIEQYIKNNPSEIKNMSSTAEKKIEEIIDYRFKKYEI